MTKKMSDHALYERLRASDPLLGKPERPTGAAEASLHRLLARGRDDISPPWRRARSARRISRRSVARLAPLAATAATAAAVISALPSNGPVSVPAASAKLIRTKAAAAIAGTYGAILHADISATQTWPSGQTNYWTEQDWQQVGSPYDQRSIDTGISPVTIETAYVSGHMWLYDASANTIYTNGPISSYRLTRTSQPSLYTLRVGVGSTGTSLTVTAGQAAALRDGKDIWAFDGQGGLVVVPRPTVGPEILSSFRSDALALLRSAGAKVTRNATVDGQSAVKVTSANGSLTYDLNPTTYAPIQMTLIIGPGTNAGDPANNSTVTLKVTEWQDLNGSAANSGLLSLTAQHPNATIDSNSADYSAAESRLFP